MGKPPYRGFSPFEIGDLDDFFGREKDTDNLFRRVTAIANNPELKSPIIVVGASGIGKSSVVRAGLAGRFAADGGARWDHIVITPGTAPQESIDEALAALDEHPAAHRVLVIDQFEEIWTQGGDAARAVVARALALAAGRPRTVVVLVLRSDFLDRLVAEPGYTDAAASGTVVIGPLDRPGLRAAIVGPAERAAVTVDPGLVELLLDDAEATGDAAGVLPLLSHSLLTTWERSGPGRLTVDGYLETGRLSGAVEKSAETVYASLDDAGRATMHDLFLGLINVGEYRVARRIAPRAELGVDADATGLLDRLVDARLVSVGDDGVQLAHEALVQAWPRLSQWVEEDRARLRLEHRIRVAAAHWSAAGEPQTLLLSSGMLDLVTSLTEERPTRWGTTERSMIEQSIERREQRIAGERRQVRKLRAVAVTAGALALVAVLAATMAWFGLADTARARDAAAQAHGESTSRQLALESRRLRPRDSALAAQLAVAAYRISETVEARSNLLDTLSDPLASRRTIGSYFEVTAAPSGLLAAVRTPTRLALYRIDARGVEDVVGAADLEPGALPGSGLVFTTDGTAVLVGTGRGVVEVDARDPAAPRVTRTTDLGRPVVRLSASADARTVLVSLDNAPPELLRRTALDAPWSRVPFPDDGFAESQAGVALSADARLAAVSAPGRGITLWDVSGPAPVRRGTFPLDGASNQAVRMSFQERTLAAGLRSREAVLLDAADPDAPGLRRTVSGFTSYVNDVEFTSDGARLVSASSDGQVKISSLRDGEPDLVFTGPEPIGLATVAGGTVLAAADGGVLRSWPLRSAGLELGSRAVFQIPVHGSDVLVANGGPDSAVGQWRAAPGPALVKAGPDIAPPGGDLFSGALALSRDGSTAVLGTGNGRVFLADLRDRTRPALSPTGAQALGSIVETVAVSPDGRTALVGGLSTPRVAVLDIADRTAPRVIGGLDVTDGVPSLGFLRNDFAVLGTAGGALLQVDLRERAAPKPVRSTDVFDASIAALAVAPDGSTLLLAASGGGHLAQVRHAGTGNEPAIIRFSGPSGSVNGAAFSPTVRGSSSRPAAARRGCTGGTTVRRPSGRRRSPWTARSCSTRGSQATARWWSPPGTGAGCAHGT
ncbi:WD40 repeat domain-containing protein [Tsukamurella sp. PLM1]|uniref:WD40 repeat domain-containing protein n=1 Tax=Tsukamurella sp. PLM1 TaxID=2929795 RepID=UPI002058DCA9|nr:WD40 repeat domain-containing protein [Tsukamurella sp. PLM1]BDH55870.1 hypothetical protein MTP03_08090 [Tsukamurella sp. PLM1]